MPANTLPIYPLTIKTDAITFVNADSTSEKTLVTAGTNGARVDVISITSDDTSARVLNVIVNDGAASYKVGTVNVPAGSGTDAALTLPVKLLYSPILPWLDSSGSIFLEAGWKINLQPQVAITSAKTVYAVAFYGEY